MEGTTRRARRSLNPGFRRTRRRSSIDSTVEYVDLHACTDAAERESLCHAFYGQVYASAFPDPDDDGTEDCATWLPLLGADSPESKPRVHITLAIELLAVDKEDLSRQQLPERRILGGIVFEWYRDSRAWLITYIAVLPSSQGRGIGSSLVRRALDTIRLTSERKGDPPYIFAEVENPQGETEAAYRRIGVLESFGFMRLKLDYTQPALTPKKHSVQDHYFLLAHVPPEEFSTDLDGRRIGAFLDEFYTSLGQRDAPYLKQMKAELSTSQRVALLPLSLDLPACYDETLGRARSITVQLLFFTDLFAPSVDKAHVVGSSRQDGAEQSIDLRKVRQRIRTLGLAELLTDAVESYHKDVVVPFVSEATMPLVICCEPFGDCATIKTDRRFRLPVPVWIDFPKEVTIKWETRHETRRVGPASDGVTDSISVAAEITDYVALFESGIAAYGVSIVLEPQEFMARVNATELLLIESLVGAAGSTDDDDRPGFRKRHDNQQADAAEKSRQLDCFVRDVLMRERIRAKSDRPDEKSIFALFETPSRLADKLGHLADKLTCFTFGDPVKDEGSDVVGRYAPNFVAVEIVGSERHDDVIEYARAASRRNVPVDQFSKRLAGIVQNVLDFDRQDSVEIQDSLLLNQRLGSEISFVHAKIVVWFGRYRRAYFDSRARVGSDPYWLLVRLVLGHNEQLLVMLRAELERLESEQRATNTGIAGIVKRLRATRRRMDRYIPDPFRYPSERWMYKFASDLRGVERQRQLIETEEQTLFVRVQEDAVREKEQIDNRINITLIAIGVIQAAGVLIAVLSLQLYPLDYWLTHKVIENDPHDPLTSHPVIWLFLSVWATLFLVSGFSVVAFFAWKMVNDFLKRRVDHLRNRSVASTTRR